MDAIDRARSYGVQTNEYLGSAEIKSLHEEVDHNIVVRLADPQLVKIVRLKLLTDRGCPFYDVSYCYGRLADGRLVRVDIGDYQLPKRGLTRRLVQLAKDAKRYGKELGLLDPVIIY